jgi:hypothetical protein
MRDDVDDEKYRIKEIPHRFEVDKAIQDNGNKDLINRTLNHTRMKSEVVSEGYNE